MDSGSVLSTMAEVSVGLTGISGIIALIRSHTIAAWDPMDLLRLGIVVAFGLGGVLFALLPLILIASGVTTEQTWGICSLALALFMIGLIAVFLPRLLKLRKSSTSPISRVVTSSLIVGTLITSVLLAGNFLSIGFNRSFSGYIIGVSWLLVGLSLVFSRMLFLAASGTENDD